MILSNRNFIWSHREAVHPESKLAAVVVMTVPWAMHQLGAAV